MKSTVWLLTTLGLFIGSMDWDDIPGKYMPRVNGARLVVGDPPQRLTVTTGGETLFLPPDPMPGGGVEGGTRIFPSISRDGNLVATARWRGGDQIVSISTYSIAEKKWTKYREGKYANGVAISPDGTRLAYVVDDHTQGEDGRTIFIQHVHVIDLATGQEHLGPKAGPEPVNLSWSPDGRQLVYCHWGIEIWDTETNQHRKLIEGQMPAWSPDGQWIAYFNLLPPQYSYGWRECMVVHPDGSGQRTLVRLPGAWLIFGPRLFAVPPVWSPDSRKLLLNEIGDEERNLMHIDLLDVATGKLKRIMKNKVPVYAWAKVKQPLAPGR